MPLRALIAALALAAVSQPAQAGEGITFEDTPIVCVIPKPQIEILLLRQDVTDPVTVAIQQAPLLPKVEKAVNQPAFGAPAR